MSSQDTPEKKTDGSSAPDSEAREDAAAAQVGQADPQSIAALAVQMLQPKIQEFAGRLSNPIFDDDFIDAIKRARWAFDVASGRSDDTFHAYQLFDEDAEPMSFESIMKRLKEVQRPRKGRKVIPTSKSTIEDDIETIVRAAATEIEELENRLMLPLSDHPGCPTRLADVRLKMSRFAHEMVEGDQLSQFVKDRVEVARQLAEQFMKVYIQQIRKLDESWRYDRAEQSMGASCFIRYVCNDFTYSQFMGGGNPEENFANANDDEERAESSNLTVSQKSSASETRLVRPYEIFLFASQAGILPGKYEAKLSDLMEGFLPQPKRNPNLSILWTHRGSPLVADADQQGE